MSHGVKEMARRTRLLGIAFAASAMVLTMSGPAWAGHYEGISSGCYLDATNAVSFAKGVKSGSSCGQQGIDLHQYINGSPGQYAWVGFKFSSNTTFTRNSSLGIDKSAHYTTPVFFYLDV